jgi:hypothetical protein
MVAHLGRALAQQPIAQFGRPLARTNTQLIKTQPVYFAELFKTDRHNSSVAQRKTGRLAHLKTEYEVNG